MCPFFENSNVFRARFEGSSHCIFLLGNCCGLFKYHALSIVKLNFNFKPAGKMLATNSSIRTLGSGSTTHTQPYLTSRLKTV